MSADNFIYIDKKGERYIGYMCFASDEDWLFHLNNPLWEANTLKDAIKKAQMESTEYGYYCSEEALA
jgi:hypothetical protein